MKCLAILGLATLVSAACEDSASPRYAPSIRPELLANGGTLGGSFSVNAGLSNDLVLTGSPITDTVDFGISFSSISEVDYFFTFGNDPLDPGECLIFGFGFCNPGTAPQTSRLLTVPCSSGPSVCDDFRDGLSTGDITATTVDGSGAASVSVASLTVTVVGEVTAQQGIRWLSGLVSALVARGEVSAGNGNALQAKLAAAVQGISRGNVVIAQAQLHAFVNQVNALVRTGRLSSLDGESLIDFANRVMATINVA